MVAPKIRSNAATNLRYCLPPFVHTERFQHVRCTSKSHNGTLLSNRKRGQENRHDSILAVRDAEIVMSCDLQKEVPVPTFIKQIARRKCPNWQSAQNKWARRETEILLLLLAIESFTRLIPFA